MNVIEQIAALEAQLLYAKDTINNQMEVWETKEYQSLIDSYSLEIAELKKHVNDNYAVFGITYELN